jgi:hypothetical protein
MCYCIFIREKKLNGQIFIATFGEHDYSGHQFVILRLNNTHTLKYQATDIIIDSWGGWFASISNAQHYPLGFINKTVHNNEGQRCQSCAVYRPDSSEIANHLKYEFLYNDPSIPECADKQSHPGYYH